MRSEPKIAPSELKALPSGLREPLREALAYWLGDAWMEREGWAAGSVGHPLDRALDRLMIGQKAITLPRIDREHLDFLRFAADRIAMTPLEGTRLQPENGYVYRTVCCHGELGVVLRLNVPIDTGDANDSLLTVESVFTAKEFSSMRSNIRRDGPWQDHGVSEDLVEMHKPKQREADQTFDLVIDTPTRTPSPRF